MSTADKKKLVNLIDILNKSCEDAATLFNTTRDPAAEAAARDYYDREQQARAQLLQLKLYDGDF